jgi:hypothetical protein
MMLPRCALVIGLALAVGACGRALPAAPAVTPEPTMFQALVAGLPDPQGNAVTRRFDSATGRAQATGVPANASTTRFTADGGISYLLPDSIRSDDATGGYRTVAATGSRLITGYAWSGDGTLAYVAHSAVPRTGSQLVIAPLRGRAATVPLPPAAPGATPEVRFSPDGRLLLLVDTAFASSGPAANTLQVRRLDGTLLFGAAARDATWADGRRLYFWDAAGVRVADLAIGTVRTILPGVRWYDPFTSPDGRQVVFELRGESGLPRLELLDTATDRVLGGFERDGGHQARFVSPTEIWFHEAGSPEIRSLDVERLTEAPTGLSGLVTDVRPRPGRTSPEL